MFQNKKYHANIYLHLFALLMSLIHVKSRFKEFVYQFLNTPTNENLEFIVLGLLQDIRSNLNDFGKFIKIILIDGANVGLNSSIIKAYHKAIAYEEGRGFTVIPIIVSNNIQGGFVHLNINSVFIGVNDASKTIDDAMVGTILVFLGKNINLFPRLVGVTICSSDFKLINTTDDDRCMSGSYPFREGQAAQRSIFGGALCLWADTISRDFVISFLIPDAHERRIPQVNYECFDDPKRLLNHCMMDIDSQFDSQLKEQKMIDRRIRDLFLGMFVQGVIDKNGLVYEKRSTEDARQYATSLTPEYSSLFELVAMVQP